MLLVVVFAGFLAGGFAPIKEIGLGLVLAIALDAVIVWMLLVPATMTLLGRYNWWAPPPLRRLHARFGLADAPPAVPVPVSMPRSPSLPGLAESSEIPEPAEPAEPAETSRPHV